MAGESILIVDDDARCVLLLRDVLQVHGYVVRTADCGEAACELVRAGFQPAVVLMDVQMPGMGGLATIAALKALPAGALARYIALTASVYPHEVASLQAVGIDFLHSKPVDLTALMGQVRSVTGQPRPS